MGAFNGLGQFIKGYADKNRQMMFDKLQRSEANLDMAAKMSQIAYTNSDENMQKQAQQHALDYMKQATDVMNEKHGTLFGMLHKIMTKNPGGANIQGMLNKIAPSQSPDEQEAPAQTQMPASASSSPAQETPPISAPPSQGAAPQTQAPAPAPAPAQLGADETGATPEGATPAPAITPPPMQAPPVSAQSSGQSGLPPGVTIDKSGNASYGGSRLSKADTAKLISNVIERKSETQEQTLAEQRHLANQKDYLDYEHKTMTAWRKSNLDNFNQTPFAQDLKKTNPFAYNAIQAEVGYGVTVPHSPATHIDNYDERTGRTTRTIMYNGMVVGQTPLPMSPHGAAVQPYLDKLQQSNPEATFKDAEKSWSEAQLKKVDAQQALLKSRISDKDVMTQLHQGALAIQKDKQAGKIPQEKIRERMLTWALQVGKAAGTVPAKDDKGNTIKVFHIDTALAKTREMLDKYGFDPSVMGEVEDRLQAERYLGQKGQPKSGGNTEAQPYNF